MSKHLFKVEKIRGNSHMGEMYMEGNVIFLTGNTLRKISPGLKLKVGDVVSITKSEKHFTTKVVKV